MYGDFQTDMHQQNQILMFSRLRQNWLGSAQLCIEMEGSHFEQLVNRDEVGSTKKCFFEIGHDPFEDW